MPTTLDRRMDAARAGLTAPGAPMALADVERFGRRLPVVAAAPPTLPAYFAHFCAQHGDAVFIVDGDQRLTYGAVHDAATRVARALAGGYGVRRGDRIGIAARNSAAWIVLYMGIAMAGGVATLLNGWWQAEELNAAIRDVGATLVFADRPRAERLATVDVGTVVVAFDDLLPLDAALAPLLEREGGAAPLPDLGGDDHATLLFTSGSTGRSRGALSTHLQVMQAVFSYLYNALTMLQFATEEGTLPDLQPATLLNLPLFHVTAEITVLLQSIAIGRKLVVMRKWDAEEAMRLIDAEQVTYFTGVPLMSLEIATHPRRADYDLSTVSDFAAGGAARPVDHVRRIEAAVAGAPLIGYGLTETNAVGAFNWRSNYAAKPGSIGRSALLVELAILDDAGLPVAQGVVGEIGIRSAATFEGYWNDPAATAAALTADGFLRTGDMGYLDEDDYVFIVDRKKDIIIRGGENISCQEVETALYRHPMVAEAAVFGLPDDRLGEVPGAVVYLRDPGAVACGDLLASLAPHLAAFKLPQRLWIADDPLPRLGTEKIDKVSLRRRFRALYEDARGAAGR